MDDEARPVLRVGEPIGPEALAIKQAAVNCLEFLGGAGFPLSGIFSVLLSSIWICSNIALDAGMDEVERGRLTEGVRGLADLIDSAAAKRDGKVQ